MHLGGQNWRGATKEKVGAMFIKHRQYAVTNRFVGFLWFTWPIGLDLDSDAWGVVAGSRYIGWTWE